MLPTTPTDDGVPIRCEVCGETSLVNVSRPPGDSVCPTCGTFLWVDAMAELTRQHSFVPGLRLSRLEATNRDDALSEVSQAIAEALDWNAGQRESFLAELLHREQLHSTGIGNGIAIPHALLDGIEGSFTAMALAPEGIPFDALDGQPVFLMIMIASPASRPQDHIQLLEQIARSLSEVASGGLF